MNGVEVRASGWVDGGPAEPAQHFRWWCPGCHEAHTVPVAGPEPHWDLIGDPDMPTLSPSVLVLPRRAFIDEDLQEPALTMPSNTRLTPRCHVLIHRGRIRFLEDCTHRLAGQDMPLPPWEPTLQGDTDD